MPDRVTVRVPATIANLGPGFDCLGVALAWHNEIRVERDAGGGLTITSAGHGAEEIPRDASNLVVRAMMGVLGSLVGVRVHLTNAIPLGRGFGSSAAAIVGGMVAGRALNQEAAEPASLVREAAALEGHADNVAPCVYGGAVIVSGDAVVPLGSPRGIEAIVCIAPTALPTEAARKALPAEVSFDDAAANAGRAALLAAALATGDPRNLLRATEDRLHQPPRFELMPDSGRLVGQLRGAGIAAFLAGAGPSVAALVPAETASSDEGRARQIAGEAWEIRRVPFDGTGAEVVESA